MTPTYTVNKYLRIPVLVEQSHALVNVPVQRYACSMYGSGQRERKDYKDRLEYASRQDRLGLTAVQLAGVFTGKGSPNEISKCLTLAARRRVYCDHGPEAGSPALNAEEGVRRVAHEYIGLDCNGFVGNWGRMAGVPGADPTRAPLDWLDCATVRASLFEVEAFDAVVWEDGAHIAVIDHLRWKTSDQIYAMVGESAAGGIQVTDYTFGTVSHPFSVHPHNSGRTYQSRIVIRHSKRHPPNTKVLLACLHR